MPQPTAPRPIPAAEPGSPGTGQTTVATATAAKAADLTVNKVLAGAGAAVTSAVLGSYFGATGTVFGAALGSVASTVTTVLYQRSLDRTRDTIVARVHVPRRGRTEISDAPTVRLEVPQPRSSPEEATTRLHVEPALRRPRKVWLWAGATVLVFVVGLLTVTGLEWAKGSTLTTSQPGTSVGRVLAPQHPAHQTSEDEDTTSTPTPEPTEDRDADTTPTADADRDRDSTDEPTPSAGPTPTDAPDSGSEPSAPAREGDRGDTDSDAVPTPEVPAPVAHPNR